ncbi:hypothetical protein BH24ACT3_BH24ACT3_11570 [soil metagenome]
MRSLRRRPPSAPSARTAGQATVEVALTLPLVALLALVLVQIGLIVRDQVLVTHAAREAARIAAVDEDPGAAEEAARGAALLDPDWLSVRSTGRASGHVAVEVTYQAPTSVALVGPLLGEVTLRAAATMRVER